jgi:hypothetical protein
MNTNQQQYSPPIFSRETKLPSAKVLYTDFGQEDKTYDMNLNLLAEWVVIS